MDIGDTTGMEKGGGGQWVEMGVEKVERAVVQQQTVSGVTADMNDLLCYEQKGTGQPTKNSRAASSAI